MLNSGDYSYGIFLYGFPIQQTVVALLPSWSFWWCNILICVPITIAFAFGCWHLVEKHVLVDDQPISASLFDFGLYFFHNAKRLLDRGAGPFFYLPKLESHLEARLWNDVFLHAQRALSLPTGTIKATVLIETVLAAFEMDEILYELRDHSSGLNAGRWDYIFSVAKKFAEDPEFVLLGFELADASGLDALAQIREQDAELPVIMLAADLWDARAADAMRQGAVAYLAHPFGADDLRELLGKR